METDFYASFLKSCCLILLIFELAGCKTRTQDEAAQYPNRPRAEDVVQEMRGLNMQHQSPIMDNGSINPKEQHREEIIKQLRSLEKEAIPALIHVLTDPDVQMRRNATLVMISLAGGYDGQPKMDIRKAIPALIKATEDEDSDVRAWAAHALAEVGPNAKAAVPALTKLLDDPDEGPRNIACIALGDIGSAASEALPALQKALNDPSKDVRQFAGDAIKKVQDQ